MSKLSEKLWARVRLIEGVWGNRPESGWIPKKIQGSEIPAMGFRGTGSSSRSVSGLELDESVSVADKREG